MSSPSKSTSYSPANNSSHNNKKNLMQPSSKNASTKVPSPFFAYAMNTTKQDRKQKEKNDGNLFLTTNAMSLPGSDNKNIGFGAAKFSNPPFANDIPAFEPEKKTACPHVLVFQECPKSNDSTISSTASLNSYTEAADTLKNLGESDILDFKSFVAVETVCEESLDTGNKLREQCNGTNEPAKIYPDTSLLLVELEELIKNSKEEHDEDGKTTDKNIEKEEKPIESSAAQPHQVDITQQRSVEHHFAFFQSFMERVNSNYSVQQLKAGCLQVKHSCDWAKTISEKIEDEFIHPCQVLAAPMYEHFLYPKVETALTKAESLVENSTFGSYAAFVAVCGVVTCRLALDLAWEAAGKVKQAGLQTLSYFKPQ